MNDLLEFTALLMREIAAEQLYRERAKWDTDKPVKSVGLRSILPGEVVRIAAEIWRMSPEVARSHLRASTRGDTEPLKRLGATALDVLLLNRAEG